MKQTVEGCKRHEPILNFFSVLEYLNQNGYNIDSDDMFLMWDSQDGLRNDSYWQLYRHWIPDENGKTLWDVICLEMGIDQTPKVFSSGYESPICIIFWVSW